MSGNMRLRNAALGWREVRRISRSCWTRCEQSIRAMRFLDYSHLSFGNSGVIRKSLS